AATFWISAYWKPELLNGDARAEYDALKDAYSTTGTCLCKENASQWEKRGDRASWLFAKLSEFLVAQHGDKYIILADEYDQPLEAALGEEWQGDADDAYLGLLMKMFKDNKHLAKGLLVGVHEFGLSNRESGLNYIGDESPGPLAALFAFTKEDVAKLVERTREVSDNAGAYSQEDITDAIDTWYGGYDFGFPGKRYSPWPVLNFLETLARGGTIEYAASLYWVSTAGAENSSIRVAGQSGKAECVLPPGDFTRVSIGGSTYPSGRTDLRSTDELVTLLLHLGYLTM
ncbi:hypothetical protein H4R21_002837, partial [Coemansia helicoidea]